MSTVYDIFNQQAQNVFPQQQTYRSSFVGQLMNFAKSFSGNPEQIVRGLLSNGQMSQDQFNRLGQQASSIQRMMNLH